MSAVPWPCAYNAQVAHLREERPAAVLYRDRHAAQDAATAAFTQAINLAPTNAEAWHDLGTSLFFAGELTESRLVYAEGYRRAPRHEGHPRRLHQHHH